MAFVAVAIGAGAVAGIGGAMISSSGAQNAAQIQADAANRAADLQYQEYQQQQANQKPYLEAGYGALSQMSDPYFQQNFTGQGMMEDDPGYQFRLNQGLSSLQNSAAARGGLMSGNTGQALTQYGQDYASNEYQNAYNRFTNNQSQRFNRLASIAGLGQTANGQIGQAGENMANNVGQDMMGAANAGGAASIAGANAYGGALSGIGNNIMSGAMYNRLAPPRTTPQTGMVDPGAMQTASDNYVSQIGD
jgi:hypothetical protein